MKQILILILLLTSLTCCNDDDSNPMCEFSDPIEDLEWLKEYTETTDCYTTIYQAIYDKQIVFYSVYANPAANTVWRITLWDCEGNTVRVFERDEQDKFDFLVIKSRIIYRCELWRYGS